MSQASSAQAPSNINMPSQNNPLAEKYEQFVRDTPLVSRLILTTYAVSYLASFLVSPTLALANIPYFVLYKLEVYRILFAPFLCTSIISLVLAYVVTSDHIKRLEFSMGSTAFGVLFMTVGLLCNLSHIAVYFMVGLLTSDHSWLLVSAAGIWIVWLPLMAIECLQAPPNAQRRLFCWSVPALYYPLLLGCLFAVSSGDNFLTYMVATGIGYAWGSSRTTKYLDCLNVSNAKCKQWEETVFFDFAMRQGFVIGHAATGSEAWNDDGNNNNNTREASSTSSSLFSGLAAAARGSDAVARSEHGGGVSMGAETFPSGSGRQLGGDGGPTQRPSVTGTDARVARLKTLEGSRGNNNKDGEEAV